MGEIPRTETLNRPRNSRYLPVDFVDRALTDNGVPGLMEWLRNNLPSAVKQEVSARKEFLPPLTGVGAAVRDSFEHLLEEKTRDYSQLLWQYARYHNLIYLAQANPKPEARQQLSPELRQKLHTSVEKLIERRIGLRMALDLVGLSNEAGMIDHLFSEASAISVQGGQVSVT